jgi:hypothetical protein
MNSVSEIFSTFSIKWITSYRSSHFKLPLFCSKKMPARCMFIIIKVRNITLVKGIII